MNGGGGNDTMTGGLGADSLFGLAGNDRLIGGAGDDLLTGGLGRDVMTGNAGIDRFDVNSVAESGISGATRDIITDFAAGTALTSIDRLDVSTIDANTGILGNQAFVFGGPFTAGHILATQVGADVILQLNTDGDALAEMTIQLSNVLAANLNAGDFFL
jgi:Ca2+-binding RTX toxin-like protein